MPKATNLEEIYQIFDTQKPLSRDDSEFYIDIYKREINKLRRSIKININPNKNFYVAGQSGSGKTTALNFLIDDSIKEKYSVEFIRGRDLFLLNDVDIVDVLLMTGYKLIEKRVKLQKEFFDNLERVRKTKIDSYKEEVTTTDRNIKEGSISANAGIKASLLSMIKFDLKMFAKYKTDNQYKKTIREMFTLNIQELIDELNKIIQKYKEQKNEELLLVFDDLEKIRNQEHIEKLFVDYGDVFNKLNCVKVITMPIYLTTTKATEGKDVFKFSFRIDSNPFDTEEERETDRKVVENREKLKKLILSRVDQSKSLIEDDVLDKFIEFSDGNLRQLIDLIQKSAISALSVDEDAETITIEDFNDAFSDIRNNFATAVTGRVEVLNYLIENHKPNESDSEKIDLFRNSLLDNMVYAFFNGDPWYGVNSVVKRSVIKYSQQRD